MSWYVSNTVTTENQRKNNAFELWDFVYRQGGSVNLAAALCANAEVESYINPGVWQGLTVGTGGYGLFQWTPANKLTNWCASKGIPSANGESQMRCLYENTTATGSWFNINATATHPSEWLGSWYMPWNTFLASDGSPAYLAGVFLCSYERSAAVLYGDRETQEKAINNRGELANKWYTVLTGERPPLDPIYGWDDLPDNIKTCIYAASQKRRKRNVIIYQ